MKYPFLELGPSNSPYMRDLVDAATRVITSGHYIGGDEVTMFETEMAAICHTGFAVGVSNGLDALRLILLAYRELGRLQENDEVIVPDNSFVASALATSQAGLKIRFADADPITMNLDWTRLPLTERTRVIMPIDLYGRVCAVPEEFKRDFIIVEDACQAIGARDAGRTGHAAAFSFYPTKNVGALGDAGAVTTDDAELAEVIRALRNYGSLRQYENIYQGLNCRLDPIQAAFLRVKLPHVDEENAMRREKAAIYDQEIKNPLIVVPQMPSDPAQHVWHQYVVRVADGRRDEFRAFMADRGVGTGIHYPTPIHRQPCYREYASLELPIADRLCAEVVSLPISRATSVDDVREISRIINQFC